MEIIIVSRQINVKHGHISNILRITDLVDMTKTLLKAGCKVYLAAVDGKFVLCRSTDSRDDDLVANSRGGTVRREIDKTDVVISITAGMMPILHDMRKLIYNRSTADEFDIFCRELMK